MTHPLKTLEQFIAEFGSITRAAIALEIPVSTVSKWAHGDSRPSAIMVRICKQKGINLDWSCAYLKGLKIKSGRPSFKKLDIPAQE